MSKGKRKRKRRIHKGRVTGAVLILAGVVVGICAIVSWCGGQCRDVILHREPVPAAVAAGRADAEAAANTFAGSLERQNALLFIRSREYSLRSRGFIYAADDYIKAATDYLKDNDITK